MNRPLQRRASHIQPILPGIKAAPAAHSPHPHRIAATSLHRKQRLPPHHLHRFRELLPTKWRCAECRAASITECSAFTIPVQPLPAVKRHQQGQQIRDRPAARAGDGTGSLLQRRKRIDVLDIPALLRRPDSQSTRSAPLISAISGSISGVIRSHPQGSGSVELPPPALSTRNCAANSLSVGVLEDTPHIRLQSLLSQTRDQA